MKALAKYAFAPDAFDAQADVLAYMQAQRRGFGFFGAEKIPRSTHVWPVHSVAPSHTLSPQCADARVGQRDVRKHLRPRRIHG